MSLTITASLPALRLMPFSSSGELPEQERDANAPRPVTRARGRPAFLRALTGVPLDPAEVAWPRRARAQNESVELLAFAV